MTDEVYDSENFYIVSQAQNICNSEVFDLASLSSHCKGQPERCLEINEIMSVGHHLQNSVRASPGSCHIEL